MEIGISNDRLFAVSDIRDQFFFPKSTYSQIKTLKIATSEGIIISSKKKSSSADNEMFMPSLFDYPLDKLNISIVRLKRATIPKREERKTLRLISFSIQIFKIIILRMISNPTIISSTNHVTNQS
jgi:hypothetical protein